MRAVTTAVLVLALALFLQACIALGPGGCSRKEPPEFSATEEQITRSDVIADLGEPIETIKSEDGHRVDIYEYDQICGGIVFIPLPIPLYTGSPDQMLTVEYGPDGSFLTAQVWAVAETPEEVIASYKRCNLPFSEAIQLDAATQYDLVFSCPNMRSDPQTDPLRWRWTCLAAHGQYPAAQRRMGILYHRGETPQDQDLVQAYKWFKLAIDNDGKGSLLGISSKMAPDQLAEAERLVAEWEPNPEECEIETAGTTN